MVFVQADLLTWLFKLVLSVVLLITSLVPGNDVGTDEKRSLGPVCVASTVASK